MLCQLRLMLTFLVEICREFLYKQKRFYDKVIVFDWVDFGMAECETCLPITCVFLLELVLEF